MKRIVIFLALPVIAWAGADGAWIAESGDVEMIYQDAGNTIKDESYANEVLPRMEFRCEAGGVAARIDWRRFISSFSTEVGFKVDGGKFTWLKWKVDGSEKVTLSPSADDTEALINLMKSGESLLVDITPYSEGPMTVTYALTGFAEAIDGLKAACN